VPVTYITLEVEDLSDWLRLTGFGFTVPNNAPVVGIEAEFDFYNIDDLQEVVAQIIVDDIPVGTPYPFNETWRVGDTVKIGGPSELFGSAPTAADVEGAGFGIQFCIYSRGAPYYMTLHLPVRLKIYYDDVTRTKTTTGAASILRTVATSQSGVASVTYVVDGGYRGGTTFTSFAIPRGLDWIDRHKVRYDDDQHAYVDIGST
jgi:hypothetical protein